MTATKTQRLGLLTDTQISVRAAVHYYSKGARPELCARLVDWCVAVDRLPRGGWPETIQGWNQLREAYPEITSEVVEAIVREKQDLTATRDKAKARHRRDQIAKEFGPLVNYLLRQGEYPTHDLFFSGVIREAYPQISSDLSDEISTETVRTYRTRQP